MDWYKVKAGLPAPYKPVLARMPGEKPSQTVREGYVDRRGNWIVAGFTREDGEVTHWTEMPVFPGDDEEG